MLVTPDTVVLIHGLWLTPRSWEDWAARFEGAFANLQRKSPLSVDFGRDDRAPLLLVAFENDHVIPPKASRHNAEKYARSRAVTAFGEFPGRPHFPGAPGWEEVADFALAWAEEPVADRLPATGS